MEPKQYYIGIDVGGTSVKEGLFDEDGNLLAKASVPTPPIVDAAGFAAVTEAIDQVVAKAQIPRAFVSGIGLAVPCPIPASGDAKVKANIAINLPELKIAIQEHCPDAVVKYENDANAAAMGEAWLGSAKGVQNVVMVTIGTGVGGGVIVNGDVVSGVVGAGGEIGHMCLNPAEERTCGCGGHASWSSIPAPPRGEQLPCRVQEGGRRAHRADRPLRFQGRVPGLVARATSSRWPRPIPWPTISAAHWRLLPTWLTRDVPHRRRRLRLGRCLPRQGSRAL